jgi:hypothetical protein
MGSCLRICFCQPISCGEAAFAFVFVSRKALKILHIAIDKEIAV